MPLPIVDFFYDIVSPYSYVAAKRIHELDGLATVRWRPCLLGGIFKATGNTGPAFTVPAKMPYMFKDLTRLAAYYGFPMTVPKSFPANTITVQRVLCAADEAQVPALSMKLFDLYWGQGIDVSDNISLNSLVGEALMAKAGDDEVKARLRENTDAVVAAGGFGAPTFLLDGELYFGEDRMFLLIDRLKKA